MSRRHDAGDGPHYLDAEDMRSRGQVADRTPGEGSLWPAGWPRRGALAAMGCLSVAFGFSALASGLIVAVAAIVDKHPLEGLVMGLAMGGFGAAVLFGRVITSLRSGVRNRPHLITVQDGDVIRTGVLLPYARVRLMQGIVASTGAALCGVGLLLGAAAVGLGWPGLVLGPPCLLAGALGVVGARRRWGGQNGLLLVPDGVLHVRGAKRTFIPWAYIHTIWAHHRGFGGPPQLELLLTDRAALETTTAAPGVIRRRRRRVDLSSAIWMLAVGPAVVYAALCHYTAHPERRAELGDDRGVQRIAQRDLR